MRKLLILLFVAVVAASSTGCNCLRNRCGGMCGGMFGGQQTAYAAAPACCPQPVQCCPQQVQCCDPCASTGATVVGSPMMSDGASCCN
jgi:hypothetical protein